MKRFIVLIIIVTTLSLGIARPKPAHADTGETVGIAVGAFLLYLGLTFLGTYLVYGAQDNAQTTPEDPAMIYRKTPKGVETGTHCAQQGGNLTVACW